jgi:hypothetical protein
MKNKKQETIEKATKKFPKGDYKDGLIDGANWQAERMYSEEQMIEFSEWVSINFANQHNYLRALQKPNQGLNVPEEKFQGYRTTKELFEIFKKENYDRR